MMLHPTASGAQVADHGSMGGAPPEAGAVFGLDWRLCCPLPGVTICPNRCRMSIRVPASRRSCSSRHESQSLADVA